jgi:hypothetical protein
MTKIKLTGWQTGFEKVKFNTMLRERLGMSLAEAKKVVDAILDDESVEVSIPGSEDAIVMLMQAKALGVVCHIVHD